MRVEYNKIKQIIDAWDPISLLAMHSPQDEYDLESMKITNELNNNFVGDWLGVENIICKVFIDSFGEDIFVKKQDTQSVAKMIFSLSS